MGDEFPRLADDGRAPEIPELGPPAEAVEAAEEPFQPWWVEVFFATTQSAAVVHGELQCPLNLKLGMARPFEWGPKRIRGVMQAMLNAARDAALKFDFGAVEEARIVGATELLGPDGNPIGGQRG